MNGDSSTTLQVDYFGTYGDLTDCSRTFGGTIERVDSALNNNSGGQSASGICSKPMNVH